MKRIILLSLISANTFATELKLSDLEPKNIQNTSLNTTRKQKKSKSYQNQTAQSIVTKKQRANQPNE